MASNTDVVKKLYYNMSVLCLYLCICMSVANICPMSKPDLQNSQSVNPLLCIIVPNFAKIGQSVRLPPSCFFKFEIRKGG